MFRVRRAWGDIFHGGLFQLRLNSSELRGSRVSYFVSAVGKVCGLFDLLGSGSDPQTLNSVGCYLLRGGYTRACIIRGLIGVWGFKFQTCVASGVRA